MDLQQIFDNTDFVHASGTKGGMDRVDRTL